jgi:hypothetical protein
VARMFSFQGALQGGGAIGLPAHPIDGAGA